MYKKILCASITLLVAHATWAQQFIGLSADNITIQHIPNNPAWVVNSESGLEVNLVSANIVAATNAFYFEKSFLSEGLGQKAVEGVHYDKDLVNKQKHIWGNIDILGPSFSYTYKKEHHVGIYSRMRQIVRGGNINNIELLLIGGQVPSTYYGENLAFNNAGFTTHTFAELGFTYGRTLYNNDFNILRGGITVKYLMGYAAGSIYTNSFSYNQKNADTIGSAKGDLYMQYTYNSDAYIDSIATNDISSWFNRAGKSSLGFDIGIQYEHHPNGTPNSKTEYDYSIAVSITDIGSISYIADTGSGLYNINTANINKNVLQRHEAEPINDYLLRIAKDSIISSTDYKSKFKVGLPTALRINTDWNVNAYVNIGVNILLNLRGNSNNQGIYRPAYTSYFNLTPAFKRKNLRISLPITYMGYQTIAIGTIFNFGPFFIGSTSSISSLITERTRSIDVYTGLVYKFNSKRNTY